jgi:AcrR family transcriptional regulator
MDSSRSKRPTQAQSGRDRILAAAYDLFSRKGVRAVGVDSVVEEAGVAKMTLYRNFNSKDDLAVAFLERREQLWTQGWLQAEVQQRGSTPAERLLAIFDIFGEWFERKDFEGCPFVSIMLELDDRSDPVRRASVRHLANIRAFIAGLATAAGVEDADDFARQWHILMKGSIVSAAEGDSQAARRAQEMGRLLLEHRGALSASV